MFVRYSLIVLALLTWQSALANDLPFGQKRIFGGEIVSFNANSEATKEQWPWIVALIDQKNSFFCGATLIAPQWLMTAAHCLYDFAGQVDNNLKISALFKQVDIALLDDNALTREVTQTIVHPQYNYITNNNDIALLKLNTPITNIEPVSLPGIYFDASNAAPGTLATILGWGSSEFGSSSQLRQAQLPIADFQECAWNYSKLGININLNMLCGGYEQGGVDACQGDSGGPLVIPHESGQGWKQLGIVSFGIGCATPEYFGVYTRISRYNIFIQTHICQQAPVRPEFSIQRDKANDTITLNVMPSTTDYTGNRIYFAPFPNPSPILHFDLSGTNSITTGISDNQVFYVAAQSLKHNCSSEFSQIILSQ